MLPDSPNPKRVQYVALRKVIHLRRSQHRATSEERLFVECCGWSERDASGLCLESPIRILPAEIFDALPDWEVSAPPLHSSQTWPGLGSNLDPGTIHGTVLGSNLEECKDSSSSKPLPPRQQQLEHIMKLCGQTDHIFLNANSRCDLEGLSAFIIIGSEPNFSISSSHQRPPGLGWQSRPHPQVRRSRNTSPCVIHTFPMVLCSRSDTSPSDGLLAIITKMLTPYPWVTQAAMMWAFTDYSHFLCRSHICVKIHLHLKELHSHVLDGES